MNIPSPEDLDRELSQSTEHQIRALTEVWVEELRRRWLVDSYAVFIEHPSVPPEVVDATIAAFAASGWRVRKDKGPKGEPFIVFDRNH